VRRTDTNGLHGIAGRLHRQRFLSSRGEAPELTAGQEQFWDQVIAELEWRSLRRRRGYSRCVCALCFVERFPEAD
jgi:hypothetical protein